MKNTFKTTGIGKKVIPATAALGILFSMAPVAENKASASIATVLDVGITTLGLVKDIYEALGIEVGDPDLTDYTGPYAENVSYRAPGFKSGEFNISMHHTKDDLNFTRPVKVLYPNGKSEIHQLKSGKQLKITEAGTIVDLNPYAESASEHNLLYITQAQLDEGKTGVALNQAITIYVEKTSGQNKILVDEFYKKRFGANSLDGFKGLGVDRFSYLTEEQKQIATLTSNPVSKDVLWNYLTSDSKALADFHDRSVNLLANTKLTLETHISLAHVSLGDGDTTYQMIPIKKGSNKVVVKKGSQYLSGKEGQSLQYSDSIGDDEVLELVQIENSASNKFQFNLINKNGARLTLTNDAKKFTTNKEPSSNIRFPEKNNNEIHNWLREWYPGKENEKQKYDGIQIVADEKDPTKKTAKDSSGNVIKNSWVNVSDTHYYAGSDGFLLKGWQEIEGNTYYFDPDYYYMIRGTGSGASIEGKYYYFNDSGVLQRSTFYEAGDYLYYADASGAFVEEGLREIDGKIYYFHESTATKKELRLEDKDIILHFSDKGVLEKASKLNGEAPIQSYVTFNNKLLVFEKDGSIRKNGVSKIFLPGLNLDRKEQPALVYYSLEEGPNYSGWKEIDGKKYHFDGGIHYTFDGHEPIDGKRYYFNHDGEAKLTGLDKVDGKTYYYDDKGVMQTGWKEIGGKWYYFQDSGEAKIGWFHVWGSFGIKGFGYFSYYGKKDGSIYQNETAYLPVGDDYYRKANFDNDGHYKLEGEAKTAYRWSLSGIKVSD
ncbi:cell wall-binding protein [Bacillus pseudomycoides]|uniref:N-acetylmuramoyl-L-alanine amidase family protein n=1 Tax=Bacillus pseudomycoides TaxID=64104 RepID=UPI00284DA074|nr:cell wall-binding protein [Bacillus pseudomycoides]MDR4190879.1 cell wall-binding protein [Bacillus pseudomycoides]MED0855042.1 cell wall-binding protein [Bacillus pseudomycoides]